MGAKQTKIEGSYLPDTPQLMRLKELHAKNAQSFENVCNSQNDDDPRSPSGCRTPLSMIQSYNRVAPAQNDQQLSQINQAPTENPLGLLRKRFFKGFTYNLRDPRSPHTNRTPLPGNDHNDRTLNLDDTFADLFVESRSGEEKNPVVTFNENNPLDADDDMEVDIETPDADDVIEHERSINDCNNSSLEIVSLNYDDEETMPCPAKLEQNILATPPPAQPNVAVESTTKQQEFDPRSPTIGLLRTPILFQNDDDDEESLENAMLESILATLSLDMSNASSLASFGTPTLDMTNDDSSIDSFGTPPTSVVSVPSVSKANEAPKSITNKHLERVRGGRKVQTGKSKSKRTKQRHRVCEDNDENSYSTPMSTPKKLSNNTAVNAALGSAGKRTPLSCVQNRSHLRSRSVEISAKSLKARLPLTSYDDSLNFLTANAKVAKLQ